MWLDNFCYTNQSFHNALLGEIFATTYFRGSNTEVRNFATPNKIFAFSLSFPNQVTWFCDFVIQLEDSKPETREENRGKQVLLRLFCLYRPGRKKWTTSKQLLTFQGASEKTFCVLNWNILNRIIFCGNVHQLSARD